MSEPAAPVILVHGAWSSARAWDGLVPLLAAKGRTVRAVDLPGHGSDPTPPGKVGLDDYAARLADVLRDAPPALLVGHSMGGMAISAAAELVPEKVRKLVYVAAFLPRDGESLLDLIRRQDSPGIRDAVRPGPQPGTTVLSPQAALDVLCQDATPAQRKGVAAGLGPQPNRAQTDKVRLTPERFGRIPRAYVFCTRDLVVTPELQHAMVAASPCAETFDIDSGHLPQITRPRELADILNRL